MSAPTSPVYDFFIAHETKDLGIALRLYNALKSENKTVFASFGDAGSKIGPGTMILHGIQEAIYNSKMVLVILTKNSLKSLWVLLEVILAWDKSLDAGKSCFKLLFYNLSPEEEADYKSIQFMRLPEFFFHKLPENFEDLTKKLIPRFSEQEEIEKDGYPGNISHGLAYSYYVGFLGMILKDLDTGIENHKDPAIDKKKMPKKFYVVLPKNGSSLHDYVSPDGSKKLKKLNTAIEFSVEVCGVGRKKDAPVYCIEQGDKKFFLVGECPSVIRPLEKLSCLDLKDLRVETPFQLARFIHTLEELLFFCDRPVFKTVEIVPFDDDDDGYDRLVENLISLAEKDLDMETYAVDCLNVLQLQDPSIPPAVPLNQVKIPHQEEVLLLFTERSRDKEIVSNISKQLDDRDIQWTDMVKRQGQFLLEAKWIVVILTQHGLDDETLCRQMEMCFYRCLEKKEINVICVTDVEYTDPKFPIIAKFCVGLDAKKDNDMKRLVETVDTIDYPQLKHNMKAGDVATGLAWAFVTNYIQITTQRLQERMEEAYYKNHKVCLIQKLLILFPKSCHTPDEVRALDGEEKLEKPEPIKVGTRKYFLQCFKRTLKTGTKVIYAREFSTPSKTLYCMAKYYEWAGLNEEGMQQQQKKLAEKVQEILEIEDVKKKIGDLNKWCEIIFYEDENLEEEIEERLQRCVNDLD